MGSFQAGVLDELLYVLDRLNLRRTREDRYRIDGITGVSAGALTGALVAQAVLRGLDRRRFLHETWVEQLDLLRLLERGPSRALLSGAAVARVVKPFLPTGPESAPSSLAAESLRLSFTLTNLTGVDHRIPRGSGSGEPATFTGTLYAERRDFELVRDDPAADGWEEIREAAIAAGTFPILFTPYALTSDAERWPGHAADAFPERAWYVDGRLTRPEPVREAARLARLTDDPLCGVTLAPDRRFLLVDASSDRSTHDPSFSGGMPLLDTTRRLVAAAVGDATARDWLKALHHDPRSQERDVMVGALAELVRRLPLDGAGSLPGRIEDAADEVVESSRLHRDTDLPVREHRQVVARRLLDRHAEVVAGLRPVQRELLGNLIFLADAVAGDRRQALDLSMIRVGPSRLAGGRLYGFAGLLEREWRQHDYTVGRAAARAELPEALGVAESQLPEPEPAVAYESPVDLRDVSMDRAPRASREAFRDALMRVVIGETRSLTAGPVGLRWALGPLARTALRQTLRARIERGLSL